MSAVVDHVRTRRLDLAHPVDEDIKPIYRICSDPRVWTHYPSLRHTTQDRTAAMVGQWRAEWAAAGLGTWVMRDDEKTVGYGGCSVRGEVWNLGYRLAPEHHGHGYATEVAREAMARARQIDRSRPIAAYLLEHNVGSLAVARRVGLELMHRGPDAGNPDPSAVRLVLADRRLKPAELASMTM